MCNELDEKIWSEIEKHSKIFWQLDKKGEDFLAAI